ncbi:hypothetical protein E3N88_04786 [Mikania micrantha]|uniref:Uncharacterized protein n=1 Tax=Mikania micrantha TaxID=192012 RepID=A0A5N6PXJ9_9ASTR|nr:hypothetical protein E3N88_04786 [Mikania micrantha]
MKESELKTNEDFSQCAKKRFQVRLGLKGLMADQVLEGSSQPVDLSKHPSGILPILQFLRCLFMIISTPSTKSAPTTATTTTKRMIFASSDNSKPAKIPKLSPDNNIKPIYVQITQFVRKKLSEFQEVCKPGIVMKTDGASEALADASLG